MPTGTRSLLSIRKERSNSFLAQTSAYPLHPVATQPNPLLLTRSHKHLNCAMLVLHPCSGRIIKSSTTFRSIIAALLCVMVAIFVSVGMAHVHADVATASHCQICALAHVTEAAPLIWLTPLVLLLLGAVVLGDPSPGSRDVVVTAFIRPPPTLS